MARICAYFGRLLAGKMKDLNRAGKPKPFLRGKKMKTDKVNYILDVFHMSDEDTLAEYAKIPFYANILHDVLHFLDSKYSVCEISKFLHQQVINAKNKAFSAISLISRLGKTPEEIVWKLQNSGKSFASYNIWGHDFIPGTAETSITTLGKALTGALVWPVTNEIHTLQKSKFKDLPKCKETLEYYKTLAGYAINVCPKCGKKDTKILLGWDGLHCFVEYFAKQHCIGV